MLVTSRGLSTKHFQRDGMESMRFQSISVLPVVPSIVLDKDMLIIKISETTKWRKQSPTVSPSKLQLLSVYPLYVFFHYFLTICTFVSC